jgi:branched-chain amino acid transport system permease protein
MSRFRTIQVGWLSAVLLALAFPYLGASRYALHLGMLFFIWAVVASYWNLLNAYAGVLSLGNLGFFALGAYISAVLAREWDVSPFMAMFIAGVIAAAVVTVFLGLPVLRLRGIYVALLTLVFADALPSIISLTREWTGGGVGLLGIPLFLQGLEKWQGYYIALVFAVIAHLVLATLLRGKTGLAFVALRDAEDFAVALGVSRFREGVKVFAISAFFTALAGAVFAHTLGQISPGMLAIDQFVMVISMWLLGGAGTFAGPIIGAGVVTIAGEYLRVYGSMRMGLLGAAIVIVVLFFPGGIVQLLSSTSARVRRWLPGRPPRTSPQAAVAREGSGSGGQAGDTARSADSDMVARE